LTTSPETPSAVSATSTATSPPASPSRSATESTIHETPTSVCFKDRAMKPTGSTPSGGPANNGKPGSKSVTWNRLCLPRRRQPWDVVPCEHAVQVLIQPEARDQKSKSPPPNSPLQAPIVVVDLMAMLPL